MIKFQVKAKSVALAPRKVALVASLVRGQPLERAIQILDYTPKRSAQTLGKLLRNARACAEHNYRLSPKSLLIEEIYVTPGSAPRKILKSQSRLLKRKLKANLLRTSVIIRKRQSHIVLSVSGQRLASAKRKVASKKV